MLVRVLVVLVCCWWSTVGRSQCPTTLQERLTFIKNGDVWCYENSGKQICIEELKNFTLVEETPTDDYLVYCGGKWITDQSSSQTQDKLINTQDAHHPGQEGFIGPGGHGNTQEGSISSP